MMMTMVTMVTKMTGPGSKEDRLPFVGTFLFKRGRDGHTLSPGSFSLQGDTVPSVPAGCHHPSLRIRLASWANITTREIFPRKSRIEGCSDRPAAGHSDRPGSEVVGGRAHSCQGSMAVRYIFLRNRPFGSSQIPYGVRLGPSCR